MLDILNSTSADGGGQPALVSKTAADWFHYSVIRSRSGIFSEVVDVTPEIAQILLYGNEKNRHIVGSHVARLSADIVGGRWDLNGESIKVARDGRLADGQHRCLAVIETGIPIRTIVTFGVDYGSRVTTDQVRVKTVGDYLSMSHGTTNANNAAAAARLLLATRLGLRGDAGMGGKGNSITKTRIFAEYEEHQKEIDNANSTLGEYRTTRVLGGLSTLIAALVLLRRISPSADDFILKFIKGHDLSAGDPILAARDRMLREKMTATDRITLLTKAFDAWLAGRTATKFIVKSRKVKSK